MEQQGVCSSSSKSGTASSSSWTVTGEHSMEGTSIRIEMNGPLAHLLEATTITLVCLTSYRASNLALSQLNQYAI